MSQPATKSAARGRQLVDLGVVGEHTVERPLEIRPVPAHRSGERAQWSTSGKASRTLKCPRPRATAGQPRRPERDAAASGELDGCGVAPTPLPPPRSAGRPARRKEEEGRARAGDAGGRPPGPHGHPWDRGRRAADPARRAPPPRLPPRLPGHRPSPEGRAPPAVDGEEAGTEEAGHRAGTRAPPPPNSSPPVVGGRPGGRKTDGRRRTRTPRRATARARAHADKPLCRGLTFNRSQRGSCSATYETPTQKQVVYEWFSARFPTNVRCVTGEGAAAFPAAPRFPGRRALRTGPRSRRAAGHAPRGARRPAGGDRRGTGYPRPTEAPRRCRIVPPGRDSDLEAFSHNPTDGSFAPLAPQPSTYTKCLNLRFLSY